MKNLRNSLLLQYLTPKHIMTNKKLILKLFAGETRENPSEVDITLEHFFSYCQSIQIEDPEDLLHEMVVNNSIIKCHKIIMESGEEIECICLTEKGLQELKMLFHENRYLKTGEMIEAELKSLLSVIQDSCFSSKKINEYQQTTETRNGIDFTTQHITRNHNERDLEIYSIAIDKWVNKKERLKYNDLPERLQTHNNTKAFLDRYKVVDPLGHSHTVVAHISKDGHYYIYPDLKQIRSISVREAARIQSFPDYYFFEGGRTAAFKQIGNAVPPLMAQAIAKKINDLLCQ